MNAEEALGQAEQLVRSRYYGEGNVHKPGNYVSCSLLTKNTAQQARQKILDWHAGKDDGISEYFGFRGNSLADTALADWPSREVRLSVALDHDWMLTGHADAIGVFDGAVIVAEHKSHADASDENIEFAFRQGGLYLGMAQEMARLAFEADPTVDLVWFEKAAWAPADAEAFWWDPGAFHAAGVLVAVAQWNRGLTIKRPLTPQQAQEILDFYRAKANAIVNSIVLNDPNIAVSWDEQNPLEFARDFHDMSGPPKELKELAERYIVLQEQEKQVEAEFKKLKAEVRNALEKAEAEKVIVPNGSSLISVSLVRRKNAPSVDSKKLELNWPDIYAQVAKPPSVSVYPLVKRVDP